MLRLLVRPLLGLSSMRCTQASCVCSHCRGAVQGSREHGEVISGVWTGQGVFCHSRLRQQGTLGATDSHGSPQDLAGEQQDPALSDAAPSGQDLEWSDSAGLPGGAETGGTDWGATALRAAEEVLTHPAMHSLALYSYRAEPRRRQVFIALDKLDDRWGSPNVEDMEAFQAALAQRLDALLGPEVDLDIEISTPGAERAVRFPMDLQRFAELPMMVQYRSLDVAKGVQKLRSAVLSFQGQDSETRHTSWRPANVKANRTKGTTRLGKKVAQQLLMIPLENIQKVNLYLDL